ncbi:unnamed protein product [Rhizopus stolonifer]
MNRRWSSISSVSRQSYGIDKKSSWRNRQKRKTFPPSRAKSQLFRPLFLEFHAPPTLSTQSSLTTTQFLSLAAIPARFSAVYIDLEGQEHKTVFRAKTVVWIYWEAGLFLFGFLFFPCWWIGALLYFKERHLFAYLNMAY